MKNTEAQTTEKTFGYMAAFGEDFEKCVSEFMRQFQEDIRFQKANGFPWESDRNPEPMKSKQAVIRMATTMMRKHGLGDWEVDVEDWDGSCCEATRSIRIDPRALRYSRRSVRCILLHEIAHALVGDSAGHGPRWQRKARSLGVPLWNIKQHAHLWETREAHRLTAKIKSPASVKK